MGRYRVPSPTPSVDSDAPFTETLEYEPPKIYRARTAVRQPPDIFPKPPHGMWVLFVGNLHPDVMEKDLFELFECFLDGDDEGIESITIRTTRGCGLAPRVAPTPLMDSDRCYATIHFTKFAPTITALEYYRKKPPNLYGLEVTVASNPADLPDRKAIMKSAPKPDEGYRPVTRDLAIQKTELVIEDQQKPQAGPSRNPLQPKSRRNR